MQGKEKLAQSSMEYLVTYGFALIIIAVAAGLLYYFLYIPRTSVPNTCTFNQVVYCDDLSAALFGSATGSGVLYFEATNQGSSALANGIFTLNINGANYTGGTCVGPLQLSISTYTPPGGSMYCGIVLPSNSNLYQGEFVSGTVYLTVKNCGLSANYLVSSACAGGQQTLLGSYSGHTEIEPELALGAPTCQLNPSSFSNTNTPVCYTQNTLLTSNITALSITVNPGVTLSTNGYSLLAWGAIINNGMVFTGNVAKGGSAGGGSGAYGIYMQAGFLSPGTVYAVGGTGASLAGSGRAGAGGGGGGTLVFAYGSYYTAGNYSYSGGGGGTGINVCVNNKATCGGNGGNTLVAGGAGSCAVTDASGVSGGTPTPPIANSVGIKSWYTGGIVNYLTGAGGGGAGVTGGAGGGSYSNSYGGSGGGGGNQACGSNGDPGGSGNLVTYHWNTMPVTIPAPSSEALLRQWLP